MYTQVSFDKANPKNFLDTNLVNKKLKDLFIEPGF